MLQFFVIPQHFTKKKICCNNVTIKTNIFFCIINNTISAISQLCFTWLYNFFSHWFNIIVLYFINCWYGLKEIKQSHLKSNDTSMDPTIPQNRHKIRHKIPLIYIRKLSKLVYLKAIFMVWISIRKAYADVFVI